MSDEPTQRTSRFGVILVLLAVGGSAVGVVGWHLMSNRNAGLDTSGFDMSSNPDPTHPEAPPSFSAPARTTISAPVQQSSLGMAKGDAGMQVVGPGASTPKPAGATGAGGTPASPKDEAVLTFKDAAAKYEKQVYAFVVRMEKKHPNITQYGKDWAASPELRALRDQYWKDKDPLKFAYGMSKSNDFGKLLKKYAGDPGVRDALVTGVKEAPPGLVSALGGVAQNDTIVKNLLTTAIKAMGLPDSMAGLLTGADTKVPDQNKIIGDIMNSADVKKGMQNQQGPVSLDQNSIDKTKDAAPNNGFTPLGGRR